MQQRTRRLRPRTIIVGVPSKNNGDLAPRNNASVARIGQHQDRPGFLVITEVEPLRTLRLWKAIIIEPVIFDELAHFDCVLELKREGRSKLKLAAFKRVPNTTFSYITQPICKIGLLPRTSRRRTHNKVKWIRESTRFDLGFGRYSSTKQLTLAMPGQFVILDLFRTIPNTLKLPVSAFARGTNLTFLH